MSFKLILEDDQRQVIKVLYKYEKQLEKLKQIISKIFLIDLFEYTLYYIKDYDGPQKIFIITQEDYKNFLDNIISKEYQIYIIKRISFIYNQEEIFQNFFLKMYFEDLKFSEDINNLYIKIKEYFMKNNINESYIEIFIDKIMILYQQLKQNSKKSSGIVNFSDLESQTTNTSLTNDEYTYSQSYEKIEKLKMHQFNNDYILTYICNQTKMTKSYKISRNSKQQKRFSLLDNFNKYSDQILAMQKPVHLIDEFQLSQQITDSSCDYKHIKKSPESKIYQDLQSNNQQNLQSNIQQNNVIQEMPIKSALKRAQTPSQENQNFLSGALQNYISKNENTPCNYIKNQSFEQHRNILNFKKKNTQI